MTSFRCINKKHARLLDSLKGSGVEAEVYIFACKPGQSEIDYVCEAFRLLTWRFEHRARVGIAQGKPHESFFRIAWHHHNLRGEPITWQAFVGSEDALPKRMSTDTWQRPEIDGFKTAFINPPHGRNGEQAEQREQLYQRFVQDLIGAPEDVDVLQWNTDACNYFDAGREWWGSFLWTLHNRTRAEIAVIAMAAVG